MNGLTLYPTTGGRWQVSSLNEDKSWFVQHASSLDHAQTLITEVIMAGKRTGGRKPAMNDTAKQLLAALKIAGIASKKQADRPASAMVGLSNGWCVAGDGVIEIGVPIPGTEINGWVDLDGLTGALENVGKELELSSLDDSIYIKSGDFEATLVSNPEEMGQYMLAPDAQSYPVNDMFKKALEIVGRTVKDTAEDYISASILLNGQTVISAAGRVILVESFHGNNMPPNLVLPKAFAVAINKIADKLIGFGLSDTSLTVWFENGSFLRTQLYQEPFPVTVERMYSIFGNVTTFAPIPTGTIEAVAALKPLAEKGLRTAFRNGAVVTAPFFTASGLLEWNASKEIKNLPDSPCFNADNLLKFADIAETIGFSDRQIALGCKTDPEIPATRIVFAAVQEPVDSAPGNDTTSSAAFASNANADDDIPF